MTSRHRESSLRRGRRNTREQRQRFLIYVEGAKTEEIYLRGLRRELRGSPVQIEIGPEHGEPLGLVRAAAKHAAQAAADPDERFDQVWCVMDVEAPRPAPGLAEALRQARRENIHCALSNPCFELWLILHFRQRPAYLTTEQAQRELRDLLPGYDLDGKAYPYGLVRDRRAQAAEHARALADRHTCTGADCRRNPCTTVTRLLAALGLE